MNSLQITLRSFVNSYQAIMWRLRECTLNDEQLASALGVSSSAIRSRRAKPDLWKLSDIERLATYFSLPTTACVQLNHALHEMPQCWNNLSTSERRRQEKLLPIKRAQIEAYNQSDWPVRHLLRMNQTLSLKQ